MRNALLTQSILFVALALSSAACSSSGSDEPDNSGRNTAGSSGSSGASGTSGNGQSGASGNGQSGGGASGNGSSGASANGGTGDFGNPNTMTPTFEIDAGPNVIVNDPDECSVGEAGSFATNEDLDLFGDIVYFNGGNPLPEGRYRISYVDGCMLYMVGQAWAVHGSEAGNYAFWLVGETSADQIMMPPGTYGYQVGSGGYATFQECVDANLALEPVEFEHAGGRLGIWLQDNPYADNLAGEEGRNPKWALTLLGSCTLLE